jgi:hypothetical protein
LCNPLLIVVRAARIKFKLHLDNACKSPRPCFLDVSTTSTNAEIYNLLAGAATHFAAPANFTCIFLGYHNDSIGAAVYATPLDALDQILELRPKDVVVFLKYDEADHFVDPDPIPVDAEIDLEGSFSQHTRR